ncbi:MAG: ribosome-binding factor A [Candidatus Borkfalkia sp.]
MISGRFARFKSAKIYIGMYGKNREEEAATFAGVQKHAGFIRHELAQVMTMRTVPELHFFVDDSMEYGDKMTASSRGSTIRS